MRRLRCFWWKGGWVSCVSASVGSYLYQKAQTVLVTCSRGKFVIKFVIGKLVLSSLNEPKEDTKAMGITKWARTHKKFPTHNALSHL